MKAIEMIEEKIRIIKYDNLYSYLSVNQKLINKQIIETLENLKKELKGEL